ncbi:Holliday junction resolvase [archaeon]|jgi:holliday junction resolvase Hjr|nr:Holliday junction resolvase [archaeon]MBT4242220.1 Holliday junction resolvase [archaeon]MBT4417908.1 Holliday junction resolvase [archaeon]
MSNKTKGSRTERELFQMFVDNSFRAVRVAGSGMMENADCDILAGKKGRKYCIEAKSTKKPIQYITKDQISRFMTFSEIFGLKPVIAVRFNRVGWYFLEPKHLENSGKNWGISLKKAQLKGKRFGQFFGGKIKCAKNDKECEEFYEDLRDDEDGESNIL